MARSVINLLPPELLNNQKKQRTLSIITWVASGSLLFVIIAASTVLLYKLVQIKQIDSSKQIITELTTQVGSLQIQESLLYNIHNRLTQINQIESQSSTVLTQYNLTLTLIPPGFKLLSFNNDTSNQVKVSIESTGSAKLKSLFDSLTNPQNAEGKVAKIELDSLARNAQDKYKLDLTINYK